MADPFRFVIVGSGNISGTYIKALDRVPEAQAVAVVSRSGRLPDGVTGLPVFETQESVDVPFDGTILCTPNGLHHVGAIEAAQMGKHVLTEKVLEINRNHMDRMMDACDQAGVTLAVSFQRRMSPDNAAVKRLLESGELGKVFAADMRVKFYRDSDYYASGAYRGGWEIDGGGPFIQQAAHNVDIMCWFFGMPRTVTSMLGTFIHDIETEDHGVALMRYPSGMIGTLTASSAARPGFPPVLEIHTDRGSVVMENDEITLWEIDGVESPADRSGFEVHSGSDSAAVADTEGHEAVIRDFVGAVRAGTEPMVSAEAGRMSTELILRIYEANTE